MLPCLRCPPSLPPSLQFSYAYLVFLDCHTLQQALTAARLRLPPAPPSAELSAYGGVVVVCVLAVLVASVLLRVEHWPLTDYRMFSKRTSVRWAQAYRWVSSRRSHAASTGQG